MNKFMQQNNITDLLAQLLSGTLTPKGKYDLYHYIMDDSHKKEIMEWLQQQWDRMPQQAEGISGEAMFAKIKEQIELETTPTGRQISISQGSKNNGQKWKMLLRYAAVFAIAFVLSWTIQKMGTDDTDIPAFSETYLQYNEIQVPYGSKTKIILSDSSAVWLNAGARLKYPANFHGDTREVFLQGEGFFDITKDDKHPFIVSINGANIRVLGTKFNLMANADDNIIETTLIEGAIEMLGLKDTDTKSNMVLAPGQKLTIHKENEHYEVLNIQEAGLSIPEEVATPVKIKSANLIEQANVEMATAWTENKLVFVKEPFYDVKIKLERWYGVTIDVKDPEILNYRFTGTFEKQTFEQAMSALSKAASCKFKIDKDLVIVTK